MKLHRSLVFLAAALPLAQAQQTASILGKTDTHALIAAAPEVPRTLPEAAKRTTVSDPYPAFFFRAQAAHAAIKQSVADRSKELPDQATMERQAKDRANASPIIAGMGGVDNIQQMTPEQRKQAAAQSMAAFQQNLVTGVGRNSPATQAMMQRLISDPAYRARFQGMSEQEKEAEMRGNMGPVGPSTPEQHQRAQQQLAAGRETAAGMAIRNELAQMSQRLAQIEAAVAKKDQAISSSPGNHEDIAREIGARIAKVPIVELGEYGHDRDPQQVQALNLEQSKRDRDRASAELEQRVALYTRYKAECEDAAAAYDSWLKQNLGRINTSLADPMSGTNTELAVVGYEDGLISLAEDLAKYSEHASRDAARYENAFNERTSGSVVAASRARKPSK